MEAPFESEAGMLATCVCCKLRGEQLEGVGTPRRTPAAGGSRLRSNSSSVEMTGGMGATAP
eukprot:4809529-Alexandrium_andersonii.AAC.1